MLIVLATLDQLWINRHSQSRAFARLPPAPARGSKASIASAAPGAAWQPQVQQVQQVSWRGEHTASIAKSNGERKAIRVLEMKTEDD